MRLWKRKKKKRQSPLGQRRRRMVRVKIGIGILLLIILLGLLWWALRLPEVTIASYSIQGNDLTKDEDITALIDQELAGVYFYYIPRNNRFFVPKHRIEERINDAFPRISAVDASIATGNVLSVVLQEREPYATWCGPEYLDTSANPGNCYFLDEESYIYAPSPDFTGNIFFRYYGPLEHDGSLLHASTSPLGKTFMPQNTFDAINVFLITFEEVGYTPVSLTRIDDKDFAIRMQSGARVIFGNDMPLATVLDNFQSVIDSDAFRQIQQSDIEYIDLRFGSKVYYKLVGEDPVEQ